MSRSSSGLGRRPLKAEITGSNPVRDVLPRRIILFRPSADIFILRSFYGHRNRGFAQCREVFFV